MKKLLFLILALALIFPVSVFATGSVVQTAGAVRNDANQITAKTLTFVCTGDSGDGSIPDTDTSAANTLWVQGWYLYAVEAFPTSGGTAPDLADVMVKTETGLDLLGSIDGVTAYAGLNLIPVVTPRRTTPDIYLTRGSTHATYSPVVTGTLTLDVDNQGTASADYTIIMTFVR